MSNDNKLNDIDKQVRQALENLDVPLNTDHWAKMAQRLDALDAKETDFDSSIKNGIEKMTLPNMPNWDLMSQRLDELDDAESKFDARLREKVQNSYINYQPKHWELMSRRLEEEFSWKGKVVRYKIVEVTLLLLVLLTVFNHLDTEGGAIEKYVSKLSEKNTAENRANTTNLNSQKSINVQKIQGNTNKLNIEANYTINSREDFYNNNRIEGGNYKSDLKSSNSLLNELSDEGRITELTDYLPILNIQALEFNNNSPVLALNNKKKVNGEIDPLSIRRLNALSIPYLKESPILPKFKKKWWTIGIFTAGSLDRVSSSYIYKFDEKKWENWSVNKGGGVTFGKRNGVIEFETGISYHNIKYNTDLPTSILEGRIITGRAKAPILTKSVELGLVQLPLSAKVHFKDMGRLHLYMTTGVTTNAAFLIDTTNFAPPAPVGSFIATSRSENDMQFPTYEHPFKIGFEKNNNNYFFTANFGLGAEYKISRQMSIYLQPQIERHLGRYGIGSRFDNISTFSIQSGIKMRLGQLKF